MAKATTRSRSKKKLQDVIESIPDDGEDTVVGAAEDNPAPDDSQFVEQDGAAVAAPEAPPSARKGTARTKAEPAEADKPKKIAIKAG